MAGRLYRLRTSILAALFVFAATFPLSQSLRAQINRSYDGRMWNASVGAGVTRITVKDAYFGAASYGGYLPEAKASCFTEGTHAFHSLEFRYNKGTLKSAGDLYSMKQSRFEAAYTYLYKISENDRGFQFRPGAAMNAFYIRRQYNDLINNNKSFDFTASISLALHAVYSWESGWSFSDRLCIPFVSMVDQTAFGTESTSIGVDPEIRSFSSFARVMNRLEIHRQLSEQHSFSMSYDWDFYRIKSLREVHQATHAILLNYHFNF